VRQINLCQNGIIWSVEIAKRYMMLACP